MKLFSFLGEIYNERINTGFVTQMWCFSAMTANIPCVEIAHSSINLWVLIIAANYRKKLSLLFNKKRSAPKGECKVGEQCC